LGSSSVDSSIKFRLPDTGSCCKPDTRIIYKDFNERIIYLRPGADNRFLVCTSRPCGVMDVNLEPYRNSALQYLPTDCGRRHVIAIVPPAQVGAYLGTH
jgi:hypothetical protein